MGCRMNVGERILEVAKLAGVTQAELAERLGVGQASISRWSKGTAPKFEVISRFASLYGVDVDWLAGQEVVSPYNLNSMITLENIAEVAEYSECPVKFLEAACKNEVVISRRLWERIEAKYSTIKVNTSDAAADKPSVTNEEARELRAELTRKNQTIDNLNAYIALLEEKLAGLSGS